MNRLKQRSEAHPLIFGRLQMLWLIVFLLFVVLILRLSWIQLGTGEKYSRLAAENNFKQIPIVAPRGKIFDRQGKPLVENQSLYTAMYLEPDRSKKEKMATAKALAKTLQMPLAEVLKAMDIGLNEKGKDVPRKQPPYFPKRIKEGLSEKEVVSLSENPSQFPGVNIFTEPLRKYRKDTFAVQTIGYVRPFAGAKASLKKYKQASSNTAEHGYLDWEQVGVDGLEYSYQDELRGKNGYRLVRVNASGKLVEVLKEVRPKPGNDIITTLDEKMQSGTEAFIDRHLRSLRTPGGSDYAPYAKNAYAVAMEVKTGKIRAMVSYPDYDPGIWNGKVTTRDYRNLSYVIRNGTIRESPYDARSAPDPDREYLKHPMSVVPLGSTFKPLTVLAGFHKGIITPNTKWSDPAAFYYADATPPIRNSGGHNYGLLTPQKAIQKSSNTFMAWVGTKWYRKEKLKSINELQEITHSFGLGIPTGIKLPGEQDGSEDYLTIAKRYSGLGAMALASFGQAQRYTTLQLAQYTATLANNGVRLRPQLVEKIINPNTGEEKEIKAEVLNRSPIKKRFFQTVHQGMIDVTQPGGTAAHLFQHLPFQVAAKTGTSEQDIPGRGRVENSVFIAFAPADDPQIAVAVVVPEGGYGAVAAGPIAEYLISSYYEQFMKR
ncbi:peptidoglycan D,D-transpeptidase FtsI family protein [Paenactinomyces guangxiensis]|uniref:Penicillin-binding protein n=1 Tax=Paenactinomyces guangxiensis TaxID=1490290 RepID=A0A7W1WN46_9BACL|nr:penicillin-binding transpeptidase domain-containing protein [Paenactinomyces guangxiensis]MBA4492939.1 penicillin-binding protein [Paenactinomyces guangxiensis]MBH8590212.1 penicillin-binding protein [Paenactinomyces guangxiensis]